VPADLVQDDDPALARVARKATPAAAPAALGIVYDDLGTSPLCTLQAVVGATGGHFSSEAALGTLSFWALTTTRNRLSYDAFSKLKASYLAGGQRGERPYV
jgi:K+ transporter